MMLVLTLSVSVYGSGLDFYCESDAKNDEITREELQTQIIVDQAGPEIFPESWHTETIAAQATLLAPAEEEKSQQILKQAFLKYPVRVLNENLKQVYVVGRLQFSGVAAGGTNSRTVVYLCNDGRSSVSDLERVFHAEFSSILLRNFDHVFDQSKWKQVNPATFSYGAGGVEAIRTNKRSTRIDPTYHEAGFLNEYSTSDLENDFNSFAAQLFMTESQLWELAEQYPRIRQKLDLSITFFESIDASLTRDYFLTLKGFQKSIE